MGDHIQVRYQGRMQDDENTRGARQPNGVRAVWSSVASTLDWEIHMESLKVCNHVTDNDGRSKVYQFRQILTIKSFSQGSNFVLCCS